MFDLASPGSGPDSDDDRPGPLDAEVAGVDRRTIGHQHPDPVPALGARLDEPSGDPIGALVVITPRDAVMIADVGQAVRCLRGARRDNCTERGHGSGR
jgi:hypothetical protein